MSLDVDSNGVSPKTDEAAAPTSATQSVPGYFVPIVTSDVAFELDFPSLLSLLLRHAWLIVVFIAVCSAGAVVAAKLIDPVYRATVVVMPSPRSQTDSTSALGGQLAGIASLAGFNLGNTTNDIEEALAIFRSRAFSRSFILDEDLIEVLFSEESELDDPDKTPSINDAVELFHSSIRSIHTDAKSGAVTLTIDWEDPETAAEWANILVQRLNIQMRSQAIEEAEMNIRFLRDELEKTSIVGVQSAIYRLMESEIKNIMLANVVTHYSFRVVDPAVASDLDDYIWPNLMIFLALAIVLGLFLSLLVILLLGLGRSN